MCNDWCLEFIQRTFSHWPDQPEILEVGAKEVNGSARPVCQERAQRYMGVDIEQGEGVDVLVDANHLTEHFGKDVFDIVISTEMVEHVYDWPNVLYEMLSILKPGGLLLLTTRSIGFEIHGYPDDHWRYSKRDMKLIFQSVGEIVALSNDMTYGYPCGVGAAIQKKVKSDQLQRWKEDLRKLYELYNVNISDRISWEKMSQRTDTKPNVNRYKDFFELPYSFSEPIRVLDLGGRLNEYNTFAEKNGFQVVSLLLNPELSEEEAKQSPKEIRSWSNELPAEDQSYDVVTFLEQDRQIEQPEFLFKEIRRILKPEGVFLLSVDDPLYFPSDDNTASKLRPPSFWVWTLSNLGFTVSLRFGEKPYELELLAVIQKDEEKHSLQGAFQALRSEFAKDIYLRGEYIHLVPRRMACTHSFTSDTLFYLLNEQNVPLTITIDVHTKVERHPDLFLDDLKFSYAGCDQDGSNYLHHWKSSVATPGGHSITVQVANDSIEISYLQVTTTKKDIEEFLLELSFDHYQRYRFVSQILHAFAKKYLSVLDVGGVRGYLQLFESHYDITTLDVVWDDLPKALKFDGKNIPFDNNSFDIVISVDTLEHIPQDQRQYFIDELCRVAGEAVILIGPFDEPNVANAENVLKTFVEVQLGKTDRFLEEHSLYTLPNRQEIRGILARNGYSVSELPNGYLPRWLSMQLADFALEVTPEQSEGKGRFNSLYNTFYYEHDNRFPAYRIAMIATREAPSFNLQTHFKALVSSREEPAYPVLWNVASLIVSLSNYGILREKDSFLSAQGKRLSRLLDHANALEKELARQQQQAERWLDHTENLEQSLQQERTQQKNLLDHTRYLEKDLSERQKHAEHLEKFISELKEHMDGLHRHTSNLENQFAEAQTHITNLDHHNKNMDQDRETLLRQIQDLIQQGESDNQQKTNLFNHIANLEKGIKGRDEHIDRLTTHIANLEEREKEQDRHIQNLTSHITNLEQGLQEKDRHIQNLTSHISNLEEKDVKQLQEQQKQIHELSQSCSAADQNAEQWKVHAKNLESMFSTVQTHAANLQTHADNLEQLLKEKEQHTQNLELVFIENQKQNQELNHQIEEMVVTNKKIHLAILKLMDTLQAAHASAKPLRRIFRDLEEELDLSQISFFASPLKELIGKMHDHLEERDRLRLALQRVCSSRTYKMFRHIGVFPSLEEMTER